jgi:3-methyladenine DNA glycosylase AlkD
LHPWLIPLRASFKHCSCTPNAAGAFAYMKGIAPFFGLMTEKRRALVREHMAEHGAPDLDQLPEIARATFACNEREMHYTAVDLLRKYAKKLGPEHLPLVEELITTKSWWDTVDILAIHAVGPVLKAHPKEICKWNKRWMTSDNLWLNRTAILFQLTWKQETDKELLFANIERQAAHKETDPAAVKAFVRSHKLAPLSEREALRKIE